MKNLLLVTTALIIMPVTACKAEDKKPEQLLSLPFLAVDLNGNGKIDTIPLEESEVYFDVDGDGLAERTEWISPEDGFINLATENYSKTTSTFDLILDLMTDGINTVKKYDKDSNGIYDKGDYYHFKGKPYSANLSFFISKDDDSDGIIASRRQDTIQCNDPSLHYPKQTEDENRLYKVQCQKDKIFDYKVVRFEYEDSNVLWEKMCERISNSRSRNYQQEYQIRCLDQGYNATKGE